MPCIAPTDLPDPFKNTKNTKASGSFLHVGASSLSVSAKQLRQTSWSTCHHKSSESNAGPAGKTFPMNPYLGRPPCAWQKRVGSPLKYFWMFLLPVADRVKWATQKHTEGTSAPLAPSGEVSRSPDSRVARIFTWSSRSVAMNTISILEKLDPGKLPKHIANGLHDVPLC